MDVIALLDRYLEKKNVKLTLEPNAKAITFNQDWYSDSIIFKECSKYEVKTNRIRKAVSPWTKLSGMDVIALLLSPLEKKECKIEIRT